MGLSGCAGSPDASTDVEAITELSDQSEDPILPGPSISQLSIIVSDEPLTLSETDDGFAIIYPQLNTRDVLNVTLQINDVSGGEVRMLSVVHSYKPDDNSVAEIKFPVVVPEDLQEARLPLSIISQSGETLETVFEFEPGDEVATLAHAY